LQATPVLPENYKKDFAFNLRNNTRMLVWMNVASVPLLFGFALLFIIATRLLRPALWQASSVAELVDLRPLSLLLALVLMVVLHEGAHGVFFALFTRAMPQFGFKGAYAYAAAPGWYIPRNQYLLVGLAPFVTISVIGLALMPALPIAWFPPLLLLLVFNAAGAIGDFLVVWKVASYPPDTLVLDLGDGFEIFKVST